MSDFRRNVIVGVFVLLGLVALGTMIVLFGEAPRALTDTYRVTMLFPKAGPVQEGDPIFMNGIDIGYVEKVVPLDDIRFGVRILTQVQKRFGLPVDAHPLIREQTVTFGKPAIRIEVGPENSDEVVPRDGTAEVEGIVAGGIEELIPRETMRDLEEAGQALTSLAQKLQPVAEDLHELLKPISLNEMATATGPARPLENVSTVVQRFARALENFNEVLGAPRNQQNLASILENFRVVSERGITLTEKISGVADRVDTLAAGTDDKLQRLSRALMDSADRLSSLLGRLGEAAEALSTREGTAGRFLNDPELYESLVLTSERLQQTFVELRDLLRQWQEKGLKLEGGVFGQ